MNFNQVHRYSKESFNSELTHYILNNYRQKTHRLQAGPKGFNAMFGVSSVDAAKLYYESFKELQKNSDKPLKVATILACVTTIVALVILIPQLVRLFWYETRRGIHDVQIRKIHAHRIVRRSTAQD